MFTHDELVILWEAISQYVDNSEEPILIAREEKPEEPETIRQVEQLDRAKAIRSKLDQYFRA